MIKYNYTARVSEQRKKYIARISDIVANVLKLQKVKVNVVTRKEIGCCGEADKSGIWITNTRDPLKVIRVIAHEMLHVKQMRDGRLEHICDDYWKWEGKTQKYPLYLLQPWEQEAFDFENYFIENLPDIL